MTPPPPEPRHEGEQKQFRKKPVVIEAVQVTSELLLDCLINRTPAPFGLSVSGNYHPEKRELYRGWISIKTLEGTMRAEAGDWIIKGVKGELYPCKPDIFEATYDPATPEPAQQILCPECGSACSASPASEWRGHYYCTRCFLNFPPPEPEQKPEGTYCDICKDWFHMPHQHAPDASAEKGWEFVERNRYGLPAFEHPDGHSRSVETHVASLQSENASLRARIAEAVHVIEELKTHTEPVWSETTKEQVNHFLSGGKTGSWELDNLRARIKELEEAEFERIDRLMADLRTLEAENAKLRETITALSKFAAEICSEHQTPDAECRICNPAIILRENLARMETEHGESESLLGYKIDTLEKRLQEIGELAEHIGSDPMNCMKLAREIQELCQ